MNSSFHFKKFSIVQDRCAMKIGTDGVLLGAWTQIDETVDSILDIGTGTGLIALMLAQRSNAEIIDALEIEENAYEQAVDNFENSPWSDRLFCYHAALDEFAEEIEEKYSVIVCNPPFYKPANTGNIVSEERKMARFYDALPFSDLLEYSSKLLSKNGYFNGIIPFSEEEFFLQLAAKVGLFPASITHVKGTKSSAIKRSLIRLGFQKTEMKKEILILEKNRHEYTDEYLNMVTPFYLKL